MHELAGDDSKDCCRYVRTSRWFRVITPETAPRWHYG